MTEAELLLLLVAIIYLSECAQWWRYDTIIFGSRTGRTFLPRWPQPRWGNQSGALTWNWPWPPLGLQFPCQTPPLALAPHGVSTGAVEQLNPHARTSSSGLSIAWDQLRSVTRFGADLFVNQTRWMRFASDARATRWVECLAQLWHQEPHARSAAIEATIRHSLDSGAIEQRIADYRAAAHSVRIVGNALWLLIFTAGPALVWIADFWLQWPWLLAALLSLVVGQCILSTRAHRRLYPASVWPRWGHALIVLVSPLSAIRAHDWLARDLLVGFHPLAVARVVLDERDFHKFAARVWLDVCYPLVETAPDDASQSESRDIVAWHRQTLRSLIERQFNEWQVPLDQLIAPPERESDETNGYCPRCREQFVTVDQNCPHCVCVPLVAWSRIA